MNFLNFRTLKLKTKNMVRLVLKKYDLRIYAIIENHLILTSSL